MCSNRRILSWFHPPLLLLFWVLIHIHFARGGAAQSGGKLRINFFCEFASWTESWAGGVYIQFETDNDISQLFWQYLEKALIIAIVPSCWKSLQALVWKSNHRQTALRVYVNHEPVTSVMLSLSDKVIAVLRKLPRIFVDSSIVYSFIQFYAALNGFIFLPGRGHARGSRGLDNKIGAAARCCENPGHNVPLETTHTW